MRIRQQPEGRDPEKARGLLVRFESKVFINRPIAEVFAFLADYRNSPKWNYLVRSVRKLTEGPVGVGTRYQQLRKHDEQRLEVRVFEPPRSLTIQTLPRSVPDFTVAFRLEPRGDGVGLVSHWEVDMARHRVLARLLGRRFARDTQQSLYRLKQLLERGRTTLQDGRTVKR